MERCVIRASTTRPQRSPQPQPAGLGSNQTPCLGTLLRHAGSNCIRTGRWLTCTRAVSNGQSDEEAEERLARLEASRKRRRPMPVDSNVGKQGSSREIVKDWKEGKLFPDRWEEMSPVEKAGELWAGERGALFWANKIAYASVFVLVGAWIVFRFVGPALGLYSLTSDLMTAPEP